MRRISFRILALLGAAALLQTGCVDAPDPDAGGAARLYVFDQASHQVLSWDDVPTLYANGSAGAADRTITSSRFSSTTLGWGGMALDPYGQYLYLVSTSGTVVRIGRIGSQRGAVSSSDIISFTLKDSGTSAEGGVFGQAAVSPDGSRLYVTESASGGSQIWAIPFASMSDGREWTGSSGVVVGSTDDLGDKDCTGVAASAAALYGYYDTGDTLVGSTHYTGSRLRKGTSAGGFQTASGLIAGENGNTVTRLGRYGCLAYDTGNDRLYAARSNAASSSSGAPLLAFLPSSFSGSVEEAPAATFSGPDDLRLIAHAGKKDWLAGACAGPAATLWIWKAPVSSGGFVHMTLPATSAGAVEIKGLALDGSD